MSPVVQSPLEEKARRIAAQGGSAGPALRHVLGLLDEARREIDRLEALALEQQRRVTLGGAPPGYHLPGAWVPGTLPGGAEPEFQGLGDRR